MRYRGLLYGLAWRNMRQRARRRPQRGSRSSDFCYAILGSHGLVKVGFSKDPTSRMRDLQTGSPFRLSLAYEHQTFGFGEQVESAAHALLDRHRRDGGEWFAVPVDVAVAAISAAAYQICGASLEEQRRPRWWFRYAMLTAALAPSWACPTPTVFILTAIAILFWACFRLIRFQGDVTLRGVLGWIATVIGAIVTSMLIASPFVAARADDPQRWVRKGATICESAEDLVAAKTGQAAKCIAAPMSMPVQIDETSGSATRFRAMGIGSDAALWADPHSFEDSPTPEEMSPDR